MTIYRSKITKYVALIFLACFIFLTGCSNSSESKSDVSTSKSNETVSATNSSSEQVVSTAGSSVDEISEANEDWYADDSQYATMEPIKKTVEGQMAEIGVDDPVRAIVVNVIQNYLFDLDGTEHAVTDINQKLNYSRFGYYIEITFDGAKPTKELSDKISDELLTVSGHKYTVE